MTLPGQEGASPVADASSEAIPRPLLILLGLGAATLAVAGIKELAWLLAPASLGVVLVVTVSPVGGLLRRRGAPVWVGVVATILIVYLILISLVLAIVGSGAKMASLIPQYTSEMDDLGDGLGSQLAGLGLQPEQVQAAVSSLDLGNLAGVLTGVASNVLGMLSTLVFVAILALFIGFDSTRFPRNLFAAREERPAVVDALYAFAKGTRTYLTVSTIFGLIVAVIDTIALSLLGIPGAVAWGVLAFVTNYIPNIGFVIGVIPPAVIGLLEGGPSLMLAVIVLYSVINFIIQSIIQPKFQADALGLTTTLTFLALVFWAWVLGPLGTILALPLTLLLKALFVEVDPRSRWLEPLLSGVPLSEPEPEPDSGPEPDPQPAAEDSPATRSNDPRR